MSYQASRFVAGLRGLTPSEKAVAYTLALHADKDNHEAYPSMALIAEESGLETARSARKVVRRLEEKNVIRATSPKTGGRGKDRATVYRFPVGKNETETRSTRTSFSDRKLGPNGSETRSARTQNPVHTDPKLGPPGPPNSKELKRSVCEGRNDNQDPHTPFTSQDGYEKERSTSKPATDQTNSTVIQNQTVYGTQDWARERIKSWPEDKKALAVISDIPLRGDRRFEASPKLRAAITNCLGMGVPWRRIVDAAEEFAARVSDKDKLPGLSLAENLENIVWLAAAYAEPGQ